MLDSSREIDVVVAAPHAARVGSLRKAVACAAPVAVANIAAANIGRLNHSTNLRRIPNRAVGQKG